MNILALELNSIDALGTVALRKLARDLGMKGMSSARGADLRTAIRAAFNEAWDAKVAEEREALGAAEAAKVETEETVDAGTAMKLGEKSKVVGRSRAGMVIVAKGSEFHKSATFKAAAEAEGWNVQLTVIADDENVDEEGEPIEKHTAIATRDGEEITLVWNGKAYDYKASSGFLGGKSRKIRNMKEALRLI